MISHAVNLNFRVSWQGVCAALQLPLGSQALPSRTLCPLCRKDALHLYHDNSTGGVWHQCKACGSSGDMIELAAAAWHTDAFVALQRLAREGVDVPEFCLDPIKISSYALRPASRRHIDKLWADSRKHYLQSRSAVVANVRNRLNINLNISPQRWQAGPGHLIGAAHKLWIDKAFQPSSTHLSKSGSRPLPGPKWDEVILTPFYDMPERIRAFAFIGRGGDLETDVVFKHVPYSDSSTEAGIGFLPAVELAGNPVNVVAVADWLLGLRVHMRHFRSSMLPLPLVAWQDNGVRRTGCWDVLAGHNLIFWSPRRLDYKTVLQAYQADGNISLVGPNQDSDQHLKDYLRDMTTDEMWRTILNQAKPWHKSLSDWFANIATRSERFELVTNLEQAGADVSAILRRIGSGGGYHDLPPVPLTASVAGWEVIERGDSWRSGKKSAIRNRAGGKSILRKHSAEREICNCVLRISDVIKDNGSGELYYFGVVRYKGQAIPFIDKVAAVQTATHLWLQAKLAEHNLGLLIVEPRWKTKLHHIAVTFQEPRFVCDDLWKWVKKLKPEKEEALQIPRPKGQGLQMR